MIYDSIKTYRIQLDPEGTMPNIDVGVRVDGRDIPDARVDYVAMIFVDRVVHTLGERRRCLVPADGFYEWKTLDAKTKQPYAFTLRSGDPFAFGGIWDAWKEPDGGWLQSFAIITTDPNELTTTVHNRMPVILKPSEYDRWLTRDDAEHPPVDLLRPYDAGEMKGFPVDPRVGNVRNNELSLCEPFECPPNSA
jgi:putative SOS response-associated peptidase YedK